MPTRRGPVFTPTNLSWMLGGTMGMPGWRSWIARRSAIQYKGAKKRIDQIGKELGVDYVLEGTVRHSGDRVRVSAQLIQVKDQTHLWAKNYERDLGDILALQQEVAVAIADEVE